MKKLDVLLINPGASSKIYQRLADQFTAIEPPTWALLLAESCRSNGLSVNILDCDALRLSYEAAADSVVIHNPRLVCFVVYGQNPNSGTTNMEGAIGLAKVLKDLSPHIKIAFIGTHTSALPEEVLSYKCVDFVIIGEGVYALQNLLRTDLADVKNVKGIGWKDDFGFVRLNEPEQLVPQERMDVDLPGYAWDLLPFRNTPLDLYRAHLWHANFQSVRTPFAAIYTSLGCIYRCQFCVINSVNRTDYSDGISAADSNKMRFWSKEWVLREIEKLVSLGVKYIRYSDEMAILKPSHFIPIVEEVGARGLNIHSWMYGRVDSVKEKYLESLVNGGIKWIALGIESGAQNIRHEVTKGSFKDLNIRDIVQKIRDFDINVIANYIVGLTGDTLETMQRTQDLAIELNTEMMNVYPCMALPGSPLHLEARQKGWELPNTFSGYSFHSYDCMPLRTDQLTSAEILKFRDDFWQKYMTNQNYLELVKCKVGGIEAVNNIKSVSQIKLKRKLLGD